jgi:hypothetical protein
VSSTKISTTALRAATRLGKAAERIAGMRYRDHRQMRRVGRDREVNKEIIVYDEYSLKPLWFICVSPSAKPPPDNKLKRQVAMVIICTGSARVTTR